MRGCKATYALPLLGGMLLFSALMELLSLQNELFRMLFYWTYIACLPCIALLLLSMLRMNAPSWRQLFVPSALLCFLMPFVCWRERTLSEGIHLYACCQLIFVALFWLLFALIKIMRELSPNDLCLKWLRHFTLYFVLVPCCGLISANLGAINSGRELDLHLGTSWIIWSRANLGMAALRYFMVAASLLVGAFCLVTRRKESKNEEATTDAEKNVEAEAMEN